ncbi:hypothetical protein D3C78_1303410 [compost metagenome]
MARAMLSAAMATGSAWKLPPEITSPSAANTNGLSDTALASIANTSAAWRNWVRQAPMTCGWQRREYGSWTFSQFSWESETSLRSPSRSR